MLVAGTPSPGRHVGWHYGVKGSRVNMARWEDWYRTMLASEKCVDFDTGEHRCSPVSNKGEHAAHTWAEYWRGCCQRHPH